MTEDRAATIPRRRRGMVVSLTVLATIGALIVGVSGQEPWIRWPALVFAIGAAAASLAISTKRSSLVGWYAATGGVLVYRLIKDLVAA